MRMLKYFCLALALAATSGGIACNYCGAEEQRSVNIGSGVDSLSVVIGGVPRKVEGLGSISPREIGDPEFNFVYNTVEGSRSGEGIALSLGGRDPLTDEVVILALALPVSLARGDEYQVGGTFKVNAGFDPDPQLWGQHDLQQSNRAEVAFTTSKYTFPPGTFTSTYQATSATGTIRVTQRQDGLIQLVINLSMTDASGKPATISGNAQVTTSRYTPPCIS
jgi:hypothetical protein